MCLPLTHNWWWWWWWCACKHAVKPRTYEHIGPSIIVTFYSNKIQLVHQSVTPAHTGRRLGGQHWRRPSDVAEISRKWPFRGWERHDWDMMHILHYWWSVFVVVIVIVDMVVSGMGSVRRWSPFWKEMLFAFMTCDFFILYLYLYLYLYIVFMPIYYNTVVLFGLSPFWCAWHLWPNVADDPSIRHRCHLRWFCVLH